MKTGNKVYPGVLVSATQGRTGKTIISMALCASLRKRALSVQPFKKGPDYIDPSWLSEAAGRECHNLDLFLMSEDTAIDSFRNACQGADLAVIEGAMGLYDGLDTEGWGSPAHLARLLKLPVILIIDTTRMTSSVAAMVSGYQHFQPDVNIAGVILNNVANKRHRSKLIAAVEQHCKIPVVGAIPRDQDLYMTQRHLGHVPSAEVKGPDSVIERICNKVEPHLDLDKIIDISNAGNFQPDLSVSSINCQKKEAVVRIGIFMDRVFNFYYPENLEALSKAGAELVFINSLHDRLPDIDGLYIGGGFPEFNLEGLESNHLLRWDIAKGIENGLPVYAECAGLMYLCRNICWHGNRYEMVGIIPAEVELSSRPQGHGYVIAEVTGENHLFPSGTVLRGHEFHHSKLVKTGSLDFAYRIKRGHGIDGESDGVVYKNVLASYTHLHALGTPRWAEAFVSKIRRKRENQPLVAEVAN
ncbi:cobyrinate a,c-diamide synthase [Chloroflexota bacterium]